MSFSFKQYPTVLFGGKHSARPQPVVIRACQPDEGISLSLMAKTAGRGMALQEVDWI